MVFGSVAEKVLKMAQCPVLLFPAPRDESSEPEKVAERGIGTARAERRESVVAGVSV
jgi:hypothetical protein